MIKNFFLQSRIVVNANNQLNGCSVYSAFSQEKEKIILECRKKELDLFLEISVNPQTPYILIREKFSKAKKNVLRLFEDLFPSPLLNISIASKDRIIRFTLQGSELYLMIRGSRTNLFAVKDNSIRSFKKTDPAQSKILQQEFRITDFNIIKTSFGDEDNSLSDIELLKKYPFIGKELLTEAKLRNENDVAGSLTSAISDILNNKPSVLTSNEEIKLAAEGLKLFNGWKAESFDSINDAVNYYIAKKHSTDNFESRKKNLLSLIEKELERTSSKINNLMSRIDAGSKEKEYNKLGNLLLINLDKMHKGAAEIKVDDVFADNKEIKIKIDQSLSPQKNADKYFEKARSEKINYSKSTELYQRAVKKYNELKEKQQNLLLADNLQEVKKMDTTGKADRSGNDDIRDKFRQYIIDGKYNLFIGRDSRNNDLLTTKFAKQNDYWFHARSVSGSHAVLRIESSKETVPKSVLKKAASIAAFHSKAKTASLAPVSYTLKKYVTKKKGMEPGKVNLLKEEVLLVKPEIPAGCEYISKD